MFMLMTDRLVTGKAQNQCPSSSLTHNCNAIATQKPWLMNGILQEFPQFLGPENETELPHFVADRHSLDFQELSSCCVL